MATTLVYEIARFGVRTDAEVLTEHAQVISRDGALWHRVDDGPETRCTDSDVTAVIATDPLVSEVRANEVTRIKAEPAALCDLPFGLRVQGDGCDYDESLWSEAMIHEHLDSIAGTDTRGVYRVLYVNDARRGAFTTDEGERLLPDDGDVETLPSLQPCWGEIRFCETGEDMAIIGPVTPGVISSAVVIAEDSAEDEIVLERSDADDAAATFVEWLLEGTLVARYSSCNPSIDVMMAQLFVEASINGRNGELIAGTPGMSSRGRHPRRGCAGRSSPPRGCAGRSIPPAGGEAAWPTPAGGYAASSARYRYNVARLTPRNLATSRAVCPSAFIRRAVATWAGSATLVRRPNLVPLARETARYRAVRSLIS
jgi:hypothetical protein